MSFLYVIAHLLSRAIEEKLHGSDGSQRKQLTRKGERNGEEISRGKTSILPLGWKDIDRFRDQKGSRITINYTWFEKISGRFLSLETEENSPREFDGKWPLDDKYFIATAPILFHKRKFFCFYVIIIHIYLNMNRYVLNVLVKKKKKTFHSSLILKSLYVNRYTSIA